MRIQQLELEVSRLSTANTNLTGEKDQLVEEYEQRLADRAIEIREATKREQAKEKAVKDTA